MLGIGDGFTPFSGHGERRKEEEEEENVIIRSCYQDCWHTDLDG